MPAYLAKPPKGALLNRGDPLARWLRCAYLFNEGGGSTLYDAAAGKKGNATLQSFPANSWTNGVYGKSVGPFDGFDDWIETPYQDFTGSGTICWGIRPTLAYNDSAIHGFWGQLTAAVTSPEFTAQKYLDNNFYIGWNTGGGDHRVVLAASAANYTQYVWQFYSLVWVSGGNTTLYRNGVQIGQYVGSTSTTSIANNMGIGRQNPSSSWFTGDVGIWLNFSRALSGQQIAWLSSDPYRMFRRRSVPVPLRPAAASVSGRSYGFIFG